MTEAFGAALEAMRAAPSDVLFVDDRQVNVDAGLALGIAAVRHVDTASTVARVRQFVG